MNPVRYIPEDKENRRQLQGKLKEQLRGVAEVQAAILQVQPHITVFDPGPGSDINLGARPTTTRPPPGTS